MGQTITAEMLREFLNEYVMQNPIWEGLLDTETRAVANFLVSVDILAKERLPAEECGFEQGKDWSKEFFYIFKEEYGDVSELKELER